jgi:hypothetical protein
VTVPDRAVKAADLAGGDDFDLTDSGEEVFENRAAVMPAVCLSDGLCPGKVVLARGQGLRSAALGDEAQPEVEVPWTKLRRISLTTTPAMRPLDVPVRIENELSELTPAKDRPSGSVRRWQIPRAVGASEWPAAARERSNTT